MFCIQKHYEECYSVYYFNDYVIFQLDRQICTVINMEENEYQKFLKDKYNGCHMDGMNMIMFNNEQDAVNARDMLNQIANLMGR